MIVLYNIFVSPDKIVRIPIKCNVCQKYLFTIATLWTPAFTASTRWTDYEKQDVK